MRREDFLDELTGIIEASNFILISCAIDKEALRSQGDAPDKPYHVERRGKREDAELELEFRRMCDGANRLNISLPFDNIFADKKVNSAGLQLADPVARPTGLSVSRPAQENRAFEDWGLKIFPSPQSEKPRCPVWTL